MTQQTIVTSALELNLGNLLGVPASVALTNALKNCDNNFIQLFNQTSLTLGTQQSIQGSLVLANTVAHAYSTTIESSNSATAAWTFTFPPNAGTSNYVLQTDGSGITSWVAQTGGSGSLTINTTVISGATAGQLLYSDGAKLQASVTLPSGTLAATNTFAGDKTTQVATDAFVQAACLLQMATVPMAITAGTYSFATLSTNFPVISITTSSGAITGATVLSGGTTLAVGDLIVPAHGNQDALLRVLTELGGVAETLEVIYGGTGYTNGSGITSAAASVVPYTYLLSSVLTGDVTILVTNGTYLNASQQWYFANNTTGAHGVTVAVSNGSNAPSAGRAAIIPQGTNNSRIVGVQTDGILNCDIASILNAADLVGVTLAASGGTGVANAAANTITFSGAYGLTLTLSNTTALTLPTSGTLAVKSDPRFTGLVPNATPINAGYTTLAADVGKLLRFNDGNPYTIIIDTFANTGVGAQQTYVISNENQSAGVITIDAPAGGSLIRLDGTPGTGARSLGIAGMCTIINLDGANAWGISGTALS